MRVVGGSGDSRMDTRMETRTEERGGPKRERPRPAGFRSEVGSMLPTPGRRWPRPLVVALVLSGGVALADALLPGVPSAQAGQIGRLFALLSGICPQRPAHSYTLGGVQLPLEARMLGLFIGLTAGVVELATFGRNRSWRWPRRPTAFALLLGFGAMAVDGTNALLYDLRVMGLPHAYTPDLRLRLATGTLAGVAMAFALVPAVAQATEATYDSDVGKRPGWRDAGIALFAAASVALLTASGWPLLLYPMALLGAASVLLALTLINWTLLATFAALATGGLCLHPGRSRTWEWAAGALAVSLALAELLGLALLRRVAGSW